MCVSQVCLLSFVTFRVRGLEVCLLLAPERNKRVSGFTRSGAHDQARLASSP